MKIFQESNSITFIHWKCCIQIILSSCEVKFRHEIIKKWSFLVRLGCMGSLSQFYFYFYFLWCSKFCYNFGAKVAPLYFEWLILIFHILRKHFAILFSLFFTPCFSNLTMHFSLFFYMCIDLWKNMFEALIIVKITYQGQFFLKN